MSHCVEVDDFSDPLDAIFYCDGDDCDNDADSAGAEPVVICINGVCYTCPNGVGIYDNNGTCECKDGSACVEASPEIQAAEAKFDGLQADLDN